MWRGHSCLPRRDSSRRSCSRSIPVERRPPLSGLEYNLIHRFNVGDALRRNAARQQDKHATHFSGRDLTYRELDTLANRIARMLQESGIRRGDAVAIYAVNSPEFLAT